MYKCLKASYSLRNTSEVLRMNAQAGNCLEIEVILKKRHVLKSQTFSKEEYMFSRWVTKAQRASPNFRH